MFQITIPPFLLRVKEEFEIEKKEEPLPNYEHAEALAWILSYQPARRWSEMSVIMDMIKQRDEAPVGSDAIGRDI